MSEKARRDFLKTALVTGSVVILGACGGAAINSAPQAGNAKKESDKGEKEVTAVEDLMREHGVLRRALLVYTESAARLRRDPKSVAPEVLSKTAQLFRTFGEDYHERKLEEENIFPLIKQKGGAGPAASYPDVLTAQHNRGREITDYILSVTKGAPIGGQAQKLAQVLDDFTRMYRHHAAREDTIVFLAWKDLLDKDDYQEMGEKFEDIEHQQFGADGYEEAVKQITAIETSLGLADIAQFTASAVK